MDRSQAPALLVLLAGLALLAYAVARGDARVGLFLILPFVYGTGLLPALGTLLIMAAAVLWGLGLGGRGGRDARSDDTTRTTRHGGVVLLGPIPIVWGSDRRMLAWMIALGVALVVVGALVYWRAGARWR